MPERAKPPSEILGALPHTRPQRRSNKRSASTGDGQGSAQQTPPDLARQPNGEPPRASHRPQTAPKRHAQPAPSRRRASVSQPVEPSGDALRRTGDAVRRTGDASRRAGIVRTLVQAGAELAEIGLSATARAVRDTVARLPRP